MKRRSFLEATLAGAAMLPALARGQELAPAEPRDWSGQTPLRYPDPDLVAVDDRFRRYILFNTPIRRHYTGSLWAEGPAWNGVGRYVVWSDIPNNRQLRWLEDDKRSNRVSQSVREQQRAILSTPRAGRFPVSTADAAWCVTNTTARSPSSPTVTKAGR